MQVYSIESTPYNELFAAATVVDNGSYLTSGSSSPEAGVFIYRINNTTSDVSNIQLIFSAEYNGIIEIYNNTEILKVNLNIANNVVTEQDYNGYEVLNQEFFNETYNQTPVSSSIYPVDFLNYAGGVVDVDSSSYQVTSTLYGNQSLYVLLSAVPAEFAAYVSVASADYVESTLPVGVPESIDASGPINLSNIQGEYTLKIPESFLKQIQDVPMKLSVRGSTDKVMKVELRYGDMSTASDYRYNQNLYYENESSLYKELIAATGDNNVAALPFAVDTGEINIDLVHLNVIGDSRAEANVYIKAPLPNTTVNLQLVANITSADSAATYNDPYAFHARPNESGSSVYSRLRHLGYC